MECQEIDALALLVAGDELPGSEVWAVNHCVREKTLNARMLTFGGCKDGTYVSLLLSGLRS